MKKILLRSMKYLRENASLFYSLVLIILIPVAFFLNTHRIISAFEKDIDQITQRKAVLAEDIISAILREKLDEPNKLQEFVTRVQSTSEEISNLTVYKPLDEQGGFEIIASTDLQSIGRLVTSAQNTLAWNEPKGIAFLAQQDDDRFWNVTKTFSLDSGKKAALISMAFSLKESDLFIGETIQNSYLVLVITILVVVLLISNQARLFGHVLALSKIEEMDKMKDTFISMASHELRGPLVAIRGYAEFLQEKEKTFDDPDVVQYINNIALSVDRLDNLVTDILEVSRIEGNRIPMNISTFDPATIIAQSVEELRSHATQKKIELSFEGAEAGEIKADPDRLKQILINLIGNAIKYTPEGSVKVSAKISQKDYSITIADTGLGISALDQAKLFEKFYRIRNDNTRQIVGTGLGLWITKELAEKMNGKITVESIEGIGSHFTLCLPAVKR